MANGEFDQTKSDTFANRMLALHQSAFLSLLISVGHRVGLFELLHTLPPADSQTIAAAGQLQERYVREWLNGLVAGGILDHDPANGHFWLPPEHSVWLTSSTGGSNFAVGIQFVPLLAQVESQIADCFRQGGGIGYEAYNGFQRVMAENSSRKFREFLVSHIIPLVPGLADRLQQGIRVLDIGCGEGLAVNVLAQAYPASIIVGCELSADALAIGRQYAARHGLSNANFVAHDVMAFEMVAEYDLITAFDAIHDQADPLRALQNLRRALKKGGTLLMMEPHASQHLHDNLDLLHAPAFYTISCFHCLPISLNQGGPGLGAMWGHEKAVDLLERAGFVAVEIKRYPEDRVNNYFVAQAG